MEAKFTKGPLQSHADHNGYSAVLDTGGYWSSIAVADRTGRVIALILNSNGDEESDEEQNANSELFAAAPELYEALEELNAQVAWLEGIMDIHDLEGIMDIHDKVRIASAGKKARAILGKARGESLPETTAPQHHATTNA